MSVSPPPPLSDWSHVMQQWAHTHFSSPVDICDIQTISMQPNVTSAVWRLIVKFRSGGLKGLETLLPALATSSGAKFRDEDMPGRGGLLRAAVMICFDAIPNIEALRAIVEYCQPRDTYTTIQQLSQRAPCDNACARCVCLSCALWSTECIAVRDWLLKDCGATCFEDLIRYYTTQWDSHASQLESLVPHVLADRLPFDRNWKSWFAAAAHNEDTFPASLAEVRTRRREEIMSTLTRLENDRTLREQEVRDVLFACFNGVRSLVQFAHSFLIVDAKADSKQIN